MLEAMVFAESFQVKKLTQPEWLEVNLPVNVLLYFGIILFTVGLWVPLPQFFKDVRASRQEGKKLPISNWHVKTFYVWAQDAFYIRYTS